MSKIISFQWKTQEFDVNKMPYKYAIPEHGPIQLSNRMWLHTYKVSMYNDQDPSGDIDIENEIFNQELNG
jgi:hypothetical protein